VESVLHVLGGRIDWPGQLELPHTEERVADPADKPRQSMEERIAAAATNGRTFDWLVANSEISWRHPADKI
jgi:hypothetical protein